MELMDLWFCFRLISRKMSLVGFFFCVRIWSLEDFWYRCHHCSLERWSIASVLLVAEFELHHAFRLRKLKYSKLESLKQIKHLKWREMIKWQYELLRFFSAFIFVFGIFYQFYRGKQVSIHPYNSILQFSYQVYR